MAKLKPIGLSFKNTAEDKKLYDWIYKHSNVSGFIKDILRKEMNETNESKEVRENINNENNLIDLGDF
ncbi:hypothetical protein ACQPVP_03440 [Clostridium nigeriense]|uniref:hypothetical protein n=1 Tax=Clostridium nigeriense TaxID=1805470 RepID=UPI003D33F33E